MKLLIGIILLAANLLFNTNKESMYIYEVSLQKGRLYTLSHIDYIQDVYHPHPKHWGDTYTDQLETRTAKKYHKFSMNICRLRAHGKFEI